MGATSPRSPVFGNSRALASGRSGSGLSSSRANWLKGSGGSGSSRSGSGLGSSSWFNGSRNRNTPAYRGRGSGSGGGGFGGGGDGRGHGSGGGGHGSGGDGHGGWGDGHGGRFRHGPAHWSYGHGHHDGHYDHDHWSFGFGIGFGFYDSCLVAPAYYPAYYPAYVPPVVIAEPAYVTYPGYVDSTGYAIDQPVYVDPGVDTGYGVAPAGEAPMATEQPSGYSGSTGSISVPPPAPAGPSMTEPQAGEGQESIPPVMDDTGGSMVAPPASSVRPSGSTQRVPSVIGSATRTGRPSTSVQPVEAPAQPPAQPEAAQPSNTQPSLPAAQMQQLMEDGSKMFGEGRYSEAANQFAQVAEADPRNVDAVLAHAVARFATGDYGVGGALIRRGVTAAPDVVNSVFDLRDRYGNMQDFEKHVVALEQRVDQHPEDMDAHVVLGFVYHFTGQRPWAAEVFKWVKQQSPNDAALADIFLNAKPLAEPATSDAGSGAVLGNQQTTSTSQKPTQQPGGDRLQAIGGQR